MGHLTMNTACDYPSHSEYSGAGNAFIAKVQPHDSHRRKRINGPQSLYNY